MIKEITEVNFPSYATLHQATVTLKEMGDRTITSQVKIDGSVVPDFSFDWVVKFKGEKFVHSARTPQAAKGNESICSTIDMTFQSWAINELKRYYFMEMTSVNAGTAIADKYEATLGLNITKFVDAFNNVLDYYFNGKIKMRLNPTPAEPYSTEAEYFEISYSHIWEVLQNLYEIYEVRWRMDYEESEDVYYISVGYPSEASLDHVFEYGYEGGLLKFERSVQSTDIQNILLGRGGEQNLPAWYFKNPELFTEDASLDNFEPDPDAIPELRFVSFENLRGWTFRSYVRGWMTNDNRLKEVKKNNGDVLWSVDSLPARDTHLYDTNWAYKKGCDDTKFDPPEYVKSDTSIAKYGEMWGALDNNDDIYPSIQGVEVDPYGRIDQIVDVEEVVTDDISSMPNAATATKLEGYNYPYTIKASERKTVVVSNYKHYSLEVPEGETGTLNVVPYIEYIRKAGNGGLIVPSPDEEKLPSNTVLIASESRPFVYKIDANGKTYGGKIYDVASLEPGKYEYNYEAVLENKDTKWAELVRVGIKDVTLVTSNTDNAAWSPTFDVWVKNIWDTQKLAGESDDDYVVRVWLPILGDRAGNEAKVVFSSGWLSGHEDWDFTMVGPNCLNAVHFDQSKEINGVKSEWRLTLQKTDAELEAIGKYVPYKGFNASPGDYFYFIGIDMPYIYVYWAEQKLDKYKTEELDETANINPTWNVTLDKVRTNLVDPYYGTKLVNLLQTGMLLNLRDKRFTDNEVYQLYVEGLTYTWSAGSDLPTISITLSDKIYAIKSSADVINGKLRRIQQQMVSVQNIEDTVAAITSKKFLSKTTQKDVSYTETAFAAPIASDNFSQGAVAGTGWGTYKDDDDNTTLEVDKLVVRRKMDVNELVVNQIQAVGGKQIISAAALECELVNETDTTYRCFFNTKRGSVANLFAVDDIVLGQRFEQGTTELKYYKYKVVAVGDDYIEVEKGSILTEADAPQEGDMMAQFGNVSDKERQGAHVISANGEGSPSWVMYAGLDSASEEGKDVFGVKFVNGEPFLFNYGSMLLGDRDKDDNYISYDHKTKELNIAAKVKFLSGSTGLSDVAEWTALTLQLENLQNQIDGAIETWYASGRPTLNNAPASTWTTDKDKNNHIGDLYYDKNNGKAYRFLLDGTTYKWVAIADEDIAAALSKANEAIEKANKTITKVDVEFAVGSSATIAPTTGWQTTPPARSKDEFLWQRVAEYRNESETPTYSTASCVSGLDGLDIVSITELFYLTAGTSVNAPVSNVTETNKLVGTWTRTCPDWENGYTFFTCSQIEYSDGTLSWTTPVQSDNIKNHTFYTAEDSAHPLPPYNVGDYWVCARYRGTTGGTTVEEDSGTEPEDEGTVTGDGGLVEYTNEILVCINGRMNTEEFDIADWTPAGDYAKATDYDYLKAALPKTNAVIDGGLVLGSFLGVSNAEESDVTDGDIVAGMCGVKGSNNEFFEAADDTHADRKLLVFAGVDSELGNSNRYKEALTQIWSDGFLKTNYAKIANFNMDETGIFDDNGVVRISPDGSILKNTVISGSLKTTAAGTGSANFISLEQSDGQPIIRINSDVLDGGVPKTVMYLANGTQIVNKRGGVFGSVTFQDHNILLFDRATAWTGGTLHIPKFNIYYAYGKAQTDMTVDIILYQSLGGYTEKITLASRTFAYGSAEGTWAIPERNITLPSTLYEYGIYVVINGKIKSTGMANNSFFKLATDDNAKAEIIYDSAEQQNGVFLGLNGMSLRMGGQNRLNFIGTSFTGGSAYQRLGMSGGKVINDYRSMGGMFEATVSATSDGAEEIGLRIIGFYDAGGTHQTGYPAIQLNMGDGNGWKKLSVESDGTLKLK